MRSIGFIICALFWLSIMAVLANMGPIGKYPLFSGLLYIAAFGCMLLLVRQIPQAWSHSRITAAVVLLGIAGRLLFIGFPVGNDIFRYVWEGYIQTLGHNPYLHAPDSLDLTDAGRGAMAGVWENINHRDFGAVYPPLTLLLGRFLAAVNPDPQFFKIVFMGIDMGVVLMLVRMGRWRKIHPGFLLLYSANPLVILYTAGEGHLDVVQVFFLCLGIYWVLRGRAEAGFLVLGLAVMTKYLSIVALPFLLTAENHRKSWTFFLPLLLYLPFIDAGPQIFASLSAFGTNMHYNDSITVPLRFLLGEGASIPVAATLLAVLCVGIYLVVHDRLKSVYLAIGCLLLLLPTLHPWYLCLIAPFMVFYPSPAWIYLQAAVCFTFPVLGVEYSSGIFQETHWLKLFEYLPFFGLLIYGHLRTEKLLNAPITPRIQGVSVIIPTLNEARTIRQAIESVHGQPGLQEILVVDGGSRDQTCRLAHDAGVRIIRGPRGRGTQIAAGIDQVGGDMIMVLHADCILEPGILPRIINAMAKMPDAVGGSLGMRFDKRGWQSGLIAWLNNRRARWTGIGFGDQAQFFRADIVSAIGGFPAVMLMEDVELSLRLKEIGRPLYLTSGVRVSNRRWQGRGFWGNFSLVIGLFVRYLFERRFYGRQPGNLANYYNRYYKGRKNRPAGKGEKLKLET